MFETAGRDDVDELCALRDRIAGWLLERGIEQWLPGEFPAVRMAAWLERGDVFVHRRNGRIAAAVAVLDEDPTVWDDHDQGAGYVHLLMVDRAFAGTGLGDGAIAFAEQELCRRGRRIARLDAVASNSFLRGWYDQRGYRVVGEQTFADLELFDSVLLEKPLS